MMKTQPPRTSLRNRVSDESGQAAAVVALFLFFVFLVFAALAIDGSAIYLTRRDLQNAADASVLSACRTIAQGGTTTEALTAALNTIQTNLGSWAEYAGPNPPTSNIGVGAGLLKGVEVSDPTVRVALQRPAPTVLTQFVGRTDTIITAQARCNSRAGGGLLPIAVQRYDGDRDGTLRDYLGNKDASGYPPNPPPVPYPQDSVTATILSPPARYPPSFQVPVPLPQYEASDGGPADINTGPQVSLVGQQAETNNIASSMSGLVLLDIRNVGSGNALEYWNGVDGQANTNKDVSQWQICRGYLGPYPEIGSQVAILDGVGANFGPQEMAACYRVGDVVAVIIYDGYVWSTPDFDVILTPVSDPNPPAGVRTSGYPDSAATAVTYELKIARAGPANAQWFTALNFGLTFDFSEATLPPGTHVLLNGTTELMPNLTYSVTNVVEAAGWSGTLSIFSESASPTQTVQYLSGLNVIADSSSGLSRGTSRNYGFGPIVLDYAARSDNGRVVVRQEDRATVKVLTYGVGSLFPGTGCKDVPVQGDILLGGSVLPWGAYFSSGQTIKATIKKNTGVDENFTLNTLANAQTGTSYTLRFTISNLATTCNGMPVPIHTVEIPLQILPGATNATPDKYVNIQGYALFRISYMDANDVLGYAVSPLYDSYEKIRFGLSARLEPWN